MHELFERVIMLQLLKTMAHSKAEDQKAMLDTILDGANKAAQTVANIRSIKDGQDPKILEPLAKDPSVFCDKQKMDFNLNNNNIEKEYTTMQAPTPPPSQPITGQLKTNEEIYTDLNNLRKKLDALYQVGVCGNKEIQDLIVDVYNIQKKLWSAMTSVR